MYLANKTNLILYWRSISLKLGGSNSLIIREASERGATRILHRFINNPKSGGGGAGRRAPRPLKFILSSKGFSSIITSTFGAIMEG